MTLKIHYKKTVQGVQFRSGHMYNFKYVAAQNDFSPNFLFLYAFSGYHPNTGRQWRFLQGISISYLPRKIRKQFIKDWKKEFGKGKNLKITWKSLTRKYPYLGEFTRRYFYSPSYYLRKIRHIPLENWEKEIVKSMLKDFSSIIKRKLASRLKSIFTGKRK